MGTLTCGAFGGTPLTQLLYCSIVMFRDIGDLFSFRLTSKICTDYVQDLYEKKIYLTMNYELFCLKTCLKYYMLIMEVSQNHDLIWTV